jgi:hypothetical protein
MEPLRRTHEQPSPEAVEFVRFCYRRRRIGWPEIYDEMCAVAGRGLYHGWTHADLDEHGIGFSLCEMPALATLARHVIAEEESRRGAAVASVGRHAPTSTAPEPEPALAVEDVEVVPAIIAAVA